MSNFDVLSREIDLNRHLLVEASAGTGKTFTIEHLFVRRLLEPFPSGEHGTVDQIAVLTFTRAAARELRERLSHTLHQTIHLLEDETIVAPDYVQQIREAPLTDRLQAKQRLYRAQNSLYQASIMTIHSFAGRILSEYFREESSCTLNENRFATAREIEQIVRDYFLADRGAETVVLNATELHVLLQEEQMDLNRFYQSIVRGLWQERGIVESRQSLEEKLRQHIEELHWDASNVLHQLEELSYQFCDFRDRHGELKEERKAQFKAFSALFSEIPIAKKVEQLIIAPMNVQELFGRPKKNAQFDRQFLDVIQNRFDPIVTALTRPEQIRRRLLASVRQFVTAHIRQKGLFVPEDLLYQLEEAIKEPAFIHFLQTKYCALFVDEFQDTDPLQWSIFSKAFTDHWEGFLYLVGDPKQAIYAFRQADVYSYMSAKKFFKEEAHVELTTNFRANEALTTALNRLFAGPQSNLAFYLPKLQESIQARALSASSQYKEPLAGDGKGAIHFFYLQSALGKKRLWPHQEAEEELFAFIASEIQRLQLPFSSFAILVKDRFQGARLLDFLHQVAIPAYVHRQVTILQSSAHRLLLRVLRAVSAPRNRSFLLHMLVDEPFFISAEECVHVQDDLDVWAEYVEKLLALRHCFHARGTGIAAFAELFLSTVWNNTGLTVKELMWQLNGEAQTYIDFEQFIDVLIREECAGRGSLEQLERFVEGLESTAIGDDEERFFSRRHQVCGEKVTILTMHKSKGLEFDVVFALGVASRTPQASGDLFEYDAEKMRQFYVAATRAKKRLYMPVLFDGDERTITAGTASPMELFLTCVALSQKDIKTALYIVSQRELLYEMMNRETGLRALEFLSEDHQSLCITVEECVSHAKQACY